MGAPEPTDCWSMYAVQARFRPDAAVDGSYEIRFDEESAISLRVEDGQLTPSRYPAENPDLSVQVEPGTLHGLIEGVLSVPAALKDGRATSGRRDAGAAREPGRDVRPSRGARRRCGGITASACVGSSWGAGGSRPRHHATRGHMAARTRARVNRGRAPRTDLRARAAPRAGTLGSRESWENVAAVRLCSAPAISAGP